MIPSPFIVIPALFGLFYVVRLAVTAAVFHGGHLAAAGIIAGSLIAAHYLTDSRPEPPAPEA